MPRFFFHFASRDAHIADSEGVELADAGAARRHAMRLVEQTRPFVLEGPDWEGWAIEVVDGEARPVHTVVFPDARAAAGRNRVPLSRAAAAALAFAAALLLAVPAAAGGYGIYSSFGWHPAYVAVPAPPAAVVVRPLGVRVPAAPFGTEPNPAPACRGAVFFETAGDPVYNAPGRLTSGTYRMICP